MSTTCGSVEHALNLLLFTDADRVAPNRIAIQGPRLQHLREVSAVKTGYQLRVGEVGALLGQGTVTQINAQQCLLDIDLQHAPPDKLPVTLVLALPRPKMLRRILRSVAEFGVPQLHLINSYRVQKSYWQSPVLTDQTIENYLLQGLAQSVDTVLPTVLRHTQFKPFVEDELPDLLRDRQGILAQPDAQRACPWQATGSTLLVIGPEGGFTDYEVTKLTAAGCEPVHLGPRILRVENAVSRLLGRLF
jgi:RsmE family RNA methyltransferase